MLNGNIFYHGTIRKSITAFGKLFSSIYIERKDNSHEVKQRILVPLSYAPKEKWFVRQEQDPELVEKRQIVLPKLSYEMNGFKYDSERHTPKMERIVQKIDNNSKVNVAFAPVPYTLDVSLYCITKTQDDMFQIIEQILPFFSPEYSITINAWPDLQKPLDIPIILKNLAIQDDYTGNFEDRRQIICQMDFDIKIMLIGPINKSGIIRRVIANIELPNESEKYTAELNPFNASPNDDYDILESWENN